MMSPGMNILELPVDIIALILTPMLVQREPIPLCPCRPALAGGRGISPLSIMLIHPAIYAIAVPLFYEGNEFVLDMTGSHGTHVRRCLYKIAEVEAEAEDAIVDRRMEDKSADCDDTMIVRRQKTDLLGSKSALNRIRLLDVRVSRLRAWIDTDIVPLVREMIVGGCLAELSVKIYGPVTAGKLDTHRQRPRPLRPESTSLPSSESQKHSTDSIFTRPPLTGLLSLLGDPYLRTASLWISKDQDAAWRPFYLLSLLSQGADGDAEGLVGIDWAKILRQVIDPEGKEVAVSWTESLASRRQRWI